MLNGVQHTCSMVNQRDKREPPTVERTRLLALVLQVK